MSGRLIVKLTVEFSTAFKESEQNNRRGPLPKNVRQSCSKYIFAGQAVSVTFRPNSSKSAILSDVTLYREFSYHDNYRHHEIT